MVLSFWKPRAQWGVFAYLLCVNYVCFWKGVFQRDNRPWRAGKGPEAGTPPSGLGRPQPALPGLCIHGSKGTNKAVSTCEPGVLREHLFCRIKASTMLMHPSRLRGFLPWKCSAQTRLWSLGNLPQILEVCSTCSFLGFRVTAGEALCSCLSVDNRTLVVGQRLFKKL